MPVPIPRPVPVTPAPIFTPAPTRAPRSYISPRPSLPPNKVKFPSTVVPRPAPSHKPSQRPRLRFRRDSQLGLRNAVKSGGRRPLVAHRELPSPPGCRSIVTQKCEKVPVKINRKLPDETCEEVPDIVCHLELESYEEPVCQNVAIEECEDVYKEIPFLVDDEKCEDIPRLECQEVSLILITYFLYLVLTKASLQLPQFNVTKNVIEICLVGRNDLAVAVTRFMLTLSQQQQTAVVAARHTFPVCLNAFQPHQLTDGMTRLRRRFPYRSAPLLMSTVRPSLKTVDGKVTMIWCVGLTQCPRYRTFTTQTKKPGAVVVGRLPPGEEEEEEEERRGRVIQDTEDTEDNGRPSSRKRKFVKLLRYLLEQVK